MSGVQPDQVPAAFRRMPPAFVGLEDDQVLKVAASALLTVQRLPVHSAARAEQWRRFDDAMSELTGRGLRHILRELRARGALR